MLPSKIKLRKELLAKLESLTESEINWQSDEVCSKILSNERFQEAQVVSVYLSMTKEVQTTRLVASIFKLNKEVFIPRFKIGSSDMEMIRLKSMQEFESLPFNKWNIRQPPDDEQRESVFQRGCLDLVLTPGLGFTACGDRLGRGKGYYDKFFARCLSDLPHPPYTIGLAFNEQILNDLPVSQHDIRLDLVINEKS